MSTTPTKPKKVPTQAAKDKAREARLRKIFNTCSEEYEKVLVYQDYACGVTRKPTSQLYLDHDHNTGLLRGLLSFRVNKGIGLFDDDPELLRAAADYLENPPYTVVAGEPVYGVLGRIGNKAKTSKGKNNRFYGPDKTPEPQPRSIFKEKPSS